MMQTFEVEVCEKEKKLKLLLRPAHEDRAY